ncbi:MAG: hypothetical protein WD767_02630 [Alphaproteobacteria bacterium]
MAEETLSKSARERLERQRIDERWRTARTVVKCGMAFGMVWVIGSAVGELAGKSTNIVVDMVLSVLADLKFVFSLTLAGAACAWAAAERILRQRKVEYLQERIRELETRVSDILCK